ncbi:MAG: diguanylate cyclase domain-containing protein, partial [Acidimicrobiia bacterium]
GSYPVLVAAILQLARRRSGSSSKGSLIDAVMLATAAGLLLWAFLMDPYFETNRDLRLVEQLTTIAYPLADLALMAVVIRLAFSAGPRQDAYYLLVAGFALLLGGDAYGAVETLTSSAPTTSLPAEAMLLASLAVMGAASLHPSVATVAQEVPHGGGRSLGVVRRLLLAAATLVAPAVLVLQPATGGHLDVPIVAACAAALALLSLARMRGLNDDLVDTLAGLRRAADREQILRQVGERLVSARGRDGIYLAAIDAVHRLLPNIERVRVFVAIGEGLHMTTVAASGANADRLRGLPVRFERTPPQLRARLQSGTPVEVDNESLIDPGDTGDWVISGRATLVVPLLSSEQDLTGCIIVATEDLLPAEYTAALTALGSQVSLALESAALNEDLLRQQSEAHFRSLVQAGSDVIVISDADGRVRYASPAVERVLGYAPEDVIGHAISSTLHPDDVDSLEDHMATAREQAGTSRPIEFRLRHSDGTWRFVESVTNNLLHDPSVRGLVFTIRDVTESRALNDQLRHQAFHDPLTGLANRALFTDRVSQALLRRHRSPERAAVLFFDLDDFKTINDSLGHAAGDELLREVARRLELSLRASDTAARLGG